MWILLVAATVLSCACANTAHNLPRIQAGPAQPAQAISKGANAANGSLKPFMSERALRSALAEVGRLREVHRKKDLKKWKKACLEWSKSSSQPIDCSKGMLLETLTVAGAAVGTDEDTNRQHDGIDEGGLVKKRAIFLWCFGADGCSRSTHQARSSPRLTWPISGRKTRKTTTATIGTTSW